MASPSTALTANATVRWPQGDVANTGHDRAISLSILHLLENGNRVQLDLLAGSYDRDLAWESYTAYGLSLNYAGQLSSNYGYDLFASYGYRGHDREHPLFGDTRSDHNLSIGGALSFAALETQLGRPYLGLQYTNTDSTISYYTYDKTMVLAGFSRQF
jgi:hypothetical protein